MLNAENELTRDELLQRALSLDLEDRMYIAEALEGSIRPSDFASADVAMAWTAEIRRRAEACERGEMPLEDWRVVLGRLRDNASPSDQTTP